MHIRQGKGSVSDYAMEFFDSSAWNSEAQFNVVFSGLAELLKDEIITHESPTSLDVLIDLAIRVDSQLQQRSRWRISRGSIRAPSKGVMPHLANTALPLNPEPKQANYYHILAAEKQ